MKDPQSKENWHKAPIQKVPLCRDSFSNPWGIPRNKRKKAHQIKEITAKHQFKKTPLCKGGSRGAGGGLFFFILRLMQSSAWKALLLFTFQCLQLFHKSFHIFKFPVNGCEPHIGYCVQCAQLFHCNISDFRPVQGKRHAGMSAGKTPVFHPVFSQRGDLRIFV